MFGKLFGDKGYVSQPLCEALYDEGVQLVTKLKRGMRNRLLSPARRVRRRAVEYKGRNSICDRARSDGAGRRSAG